MGIPVIEYPDYEVFADGRVFSHKSNKFLKPVTHANGYAFVELFNEFGSKIKSIHRLVAEAFIPNPHGYPCVNHKDENPLNNRVENLEWCTHKYNSNYGTCVERRVAHTDYTKPSYRENAIKNGKTTSKIVCQFAKDGHLISTFSSGKEASVITKVNHSHLLECCKGKRKTAGGYVWKYFEKGGDDLSVSLY